jgi:hypothetical protein
MTEQARRHSLFDADFADAMRIATDCIKIVVGHEIGGRRALLARRNGDVGSIEALNVSISAEI